MSLPELLLLRFFGLFRFFLCPPHQPLCLDSGQLFPDSGLVCRYMLHVHENVQVRIKT